MIRRIEFSELSIPPVPFDRSPQAADKISSCPKAKHFDCPADIQSSARLTVRLGCIPDYLTVKAGLFRNQIHQIKNADLLARAKVNRITTVIFFRGYPNAFG